MRRRGRRRRGGGVAGTAGRRGKPAGREGTGQGRQHREEGRRGSRRVGTAPSESRPASPILDLMITTMGTRMAGIRDRGTAPVNRGTAPTIGAGVLLRCPFTGRALRQQGY